MTPEEAIETLRQKQLIYCREGDQRVRNALNLGIEALKLYKSCGHPTRCGMLIRLPGETEE